MTRRIALAALVLAMVAGLAYAELGFTSVSATTTSQYVAIGYGSLTVVNDGSGIAYIRVFWEGESVKETNGAYKAATSSYAKVASGESLEFSRALSIQGVSIVSASTSTVRLYYW